MNKKRFIRVELKFATCGIMVSAKGIIIEAPPIMKCWVGSRYEKFYTYYERKGTLIKTEVLE